MERLTVSLAKLNKQLNKYIRLVNKYVCIHVDICAECSDPDTPADIKAAATGDGSILLVWRPPLHSNGILTKYTIVMKDMSDREVTAVLFNIYVVLSIASLILCRYISLLGVPSCLLYTSDAADE